MKVFESMAAKATFINSDSNALFSNMQHYLLGQSNSPIGEHF